MVVHACNRDWIIKGGFRALAEDYGTGRMLDRPSMRGRRAA